MNKWHQFVSNPVIWLILLTGLVCFSLMLELLLDNNKNKQWQLRVLSWIPSLKVMLNCLPLLGLLGTIIGLLATFTQMSNVTMDQQALLSGGIADAMLTTQVGLLVFIPGWLMLAYLTKTHLHHQVYLDSSATNSPNVKDN